MQTESTTNPRKPLLVNGVVLIGLLAVSWFFSGFMFGGRGFLYSDDWFAVATSHAGMYTYCTAFENALTPWRPFHATPICLIQNVTSPNSWVYNLMSFVVFGLTGFAWYGIVRNVFRVSAWIAFVAAVIFVAAPDDEAWLSLVGWYRLVGPMLTLYGIGLVLRYWDHLGRWWTLLAGCLLTAFGFLMYETLFAVWTLGVPLALLYKARRLSWRLVWVTGAVGLVSVTNLLWRFWLMPITYEGPVVGQHNILIEPANVLRQVASSLLLPFFRWYDAVGWAVTGRSVGTGGVGYDLYVIAVALLAGGVMALFLYGLRSITDESQGVPPATGRNLLLAGFIIVPLASVPFYIVYLDVVFDAFRSLASTLTTSLLLVALFVTPIPRRTVRRLSVVAVVVVMFKTVVSGYQVESWQYRTGIYCDFYMNLAGHIEALPQDIYVAVTSEDETLLAREPLSFFWESVLSSSITMMMYHPGPYEPDSFNLGQMGYSGYLLAMAHEVEQAEGGAVIEFPPEVQNIMHALRPLPDVYPAEDLIIIDYTPFERFDIVAAPEREGLVIDPDGNARGRAYETMSGYCDWYTPQ